MDMRTRGGDRQVTASFASPYRTDIQGLRAIAVLSVLIFHANPALMPGGFVGVDIFFVISGYLITGIILKDCYNNSFSVASFYRRRIRRIFPALLVMLIATLVAGYVLLAPTDFRSVARNTISSTLFVSNIDFYLSTNYFAGPSSLKPLLHTWSLSVEEQFYIIFPFIIFLSYKYARPHITSVFTVLFLVGLVVSQVMVTHSAEQGYFLAPARAFEFLVGSVLAARPSYAFLSGRVRDSVALLGIALMLVPMFLYSETLPFPGVTALVPCLGVGAVIAAGLTGESFGGRLISSGPFIFFGNISYSLYLWHWPILAYMRNIYGIELDSIQISIAILLSILAGSASYYFVEQPFLRPRLAGIPFLTAGAVSMGVMVSVGAAIMAMKGMPGRFSPEAQAMFAGATDFNPHRARCHNGSESPMAYGENCVFGAKGVKPDVVVWGDSHGAELVIALSAYAEKAGRSIMQLTASACPPSINFSLGRRPFCRIHNRQMLRAIAEDTSVKTVVLAVNGATYLKQVPEVANLAGDGADAKTLQSGYEEVVHALLAAGKSVVVMSQIPVMNSDPPKIAGFAVQRGEDPGVLGLTRQQYEADSMRWNKVVSGVAQQPGVTYLDVAELLCDSNLCRIYDKDRGMLYFNPTHLSLKGTELLAAKLAPSLY